MLPTLDCHAHLDPSLSPRELSSSGAVLAMGISLAEVEKFFKLSAPMQVYMQEVDNKILPGVKPKFL